jgi:phospholipid/cholesterol/gamma-HCH transport system permease protein
MEVSAINPFKFLVVARTLATTLMVPALMLYCCLMGLIGSFLNISSNEATSLSAFLKGGFSNVDFLTLGTSVTKSFIFGLSIGIIACYKGYNATSGTQGVGRAANASVVLSMFVIFIEEVLVVQVSLWIRAF